MAEQVKVSVPWTLPLLAVALAVLSACVVLPQAEANRKQMYELARLEVELKHLLEQGELNGQFLERLGTDVDLSQRLAHRQMRLVPAGTAELALPEEGAAGSLVSPFGLVKLPAPQLSAGYTPIGGGWLDPLMDARTRLYVMGGAMLVMALGLIWEPGRKSGVLRTSTAG
jgi:hypothetical protein